MNPPHSPLASVLLEVIQPRELDRAAGDEIPVTLNALKIREMHEAEPWAIWSRNGAPTLLVVPEGDGATTHEVRSYCAVRGRRSGAEGAEMSPYAGCGAYAVPVPG